MPPRDPHNVKVEFEVLDDSFRQLWTGGSYVKVNAADFLGKRQLEVTRGTNGYAIVVTQPVSIHSLDEAKNLPTAAPGDWQLAQDFSTRNPTCFSTPMTIWKRCSTKPTRHCSPDELESNSIYIFNNKVNRNRIVASWDGRFHRYKIFKPGDDTAWLHAVEAPPISDQLQAMVSQVQAALPGILSLTNKISRRAGQHRERDFKSELHHRRRAADGDQFRRHQRAVARAGRPVVWALGTNGERTGARRVDECEFAAGGHGHQ